MTASGRELRLAEPAQGGATGLEASLLVLAADEALVRPRDLEDLDQLGLRHHVPAGVAVMEDLDGLVERRAIDHRVVRRQRHPQDVRVLVLERAGQVVVDLVEAQRQRLLDRAAQRLGAAPAAPRSREPVQRRRLRRSGTRAPRPSTAGRAPRARTARRAAPARRRSRPRGDRISSSRARVIAT